MPPLDPDVADLAPSDPALTSYDEEHAVTCMRMLDADADGADRREIARIVLHLDPDRERRWGPFQIVVTENGANLDYMDTDSEIAPQHYAFLISEAEFDEIFGRIRVDRKLSYWADPGRRQLGEINHHDGGRGVYFEDPNGHLLEIITRPYGSGGWNP